VEIETVADQRLVSRAIREGWPVSEEMKQKLVEQTYKRATGGIAEVEEAATKTLIAMDKRNQDLRAEEQKRIEAEHARKLQLIELAVKLGLAGNDQHGAGALDNLSAARINAGSSEGSKAAEV
jgi:hypothetical protein